MDFSDLESRIDNMLKSGYGAKEIVELLVEEKFTSTNSKSMPCKHDNYKMHEYVAAFQCNDCGKQWF